jgi:mannonate dehydratase
MEKTWRWFGPKDKISLSDLRQIGVEGIVTSLHDVAAGEVWTPAAVNDMRNYIARSGLHWSVVESLPVSEAIKYGGEDADRLIANYIESLVSLGEAGVKTVCYNFMPVIDWIRTDLRHPWDDGTTSLYFDRVRFAYFDCCILERPGAEADYTAEEMTAVRRLAKTITEAEKDELIDSIIVKTQGFVHGNIKEGDKNPVAIFKRLLALYDGIDRAALRENMRYFLSQLMPVCEEYGIGMCVHPDDPPIQVLGLPRIVTSGDDIEWMLKAVDHPSNGLTFCAGSLSSGAHNDVVELAKRFASRVRFVHLRSTEVMADGNFIEASHLAGRGNLIELVRIFEKANPLLPMRIDHGRDMLGDAQGGYNPGYGFYGRMFALAQIDGVMATVRNEMEQGYEKRK